jgi:hypothetical protein
VVSGDELLAVGARIAKADLERARVERLPPRCKTHGCEMSEQEDGWLCAACEDGDDFDRNACPGCGGSCQTACR